MKRNWVAEMRMAIAVGALTIVGLLIAAAGMRAQPTKVSSLGLRADTRSIHRAGITGVAAGQPLSDGGAKTWQPNLAVALRGIADEVPQAEPAGAENGPHDFDWDIGTWKTHQRRLLHPLTGSTTWVDYTGTDVVQKIWDGADLGKIEADGPAGHLEIFTVRLYDPDAHTWGIYFTNPGTGTLTLPAVGEFRNGRADFYDQETYNGKPILLRFSVVDFTADSCDFEQAFSPDWGKTWEVNFKVSETRVKQ